MNPGHVTYTSFGFSDQSCVLKKFLFTIIKPSPGVSSEPIFWHFSIFKILSESLMQRLRSCAAGKDGLVFSAFRAEGPYKQRKLGTVFPHNGKEHQGTRRILIVRSLYKDQNMNQGENMAPSAVSHGNPSPKGRPHFGRKKQVFIIIHC